MKDPWYLFCFVFFFLGGGGGFLTFGKRKVTNLGTCLDIGLPDSDARNVYFSQWRVWRLPQPEALNPKGLCPGQPPALLLLDAGRMQQPSHLVTKPLGSVASAVWGSVRGKTLDPKP